MTPLEQIKNGILTGNMQSVADGYNRITNDIVLPKDTSKPSRLATDRRIKPSKREEQQSTFDDVQFQVDTNTTGNKMEKEARVEQFIPKRRVNLWNDTKKEPLIDYSEKDKKDDIRTRHSPKVARRATYEPVKTNCFSCGRGFKVNPAFIIGGKYRCDACSSGK